MSEAARGADNDARSLKILLPAEFVARYLGEEDKVYAHMICHEAWRPFSTAMIRSVLDAVRNRVLTLALDIEREFPELVEELKPLSPEKAGHLSQIFNIEVLGGTNTIAAGNRDVVQSEVRAGDWNSLRNALLALGLPQAELNELRSALDKDGNQTTELGRRTRMWLGRVAELAARGALAVAPEASGGVIAALIVKYVGIG